MKLKSSALLCTFAFLLGTFALSAGSIVLGWDPPDSTNIITGYTVWVMPSTGGSTATRLGNVLGAEITDAPGVYTINVTAQSAEGDSDPSNTVVATIPGVVVTASPPVLQPPVVTYDAGAQSYSLALAWSAPIGVADPVTYEVSMSGLGVTKVYGALHPYTARTLTISGWGPGAYVLIVTAKTDTTRLASAAVPVNLPTVKIKPHPPRNFTVIGVTP